MPGTDKVYGAARAMPSPVLRLVSGTARACQLDQIWVGNINAVGSPICLRACYAEPGSEIAHGTIYQY
eukprot:3309453-Rhodomonas_salina.1